MQDQLPSIQIQSVLYNNTFDSIERALASIVRSAELAKYYNVCGSTQVRYGDCSSLPCLSDEQVLELREKFANIITLDYYFFDQNLGSARGHNRLAEEAGTDFIHIQNPDVVVSPRTLQIFLETLRLSKVGIVEAKQLPIEHPKEYDRYTGETSWSSTACIMTPTSLFREVSGFDADSFFLYCDDVDFSWRVRLLGYKCVFQPAATVFHDKRLSSEGKWQPTSSERYYSAEAALFLAHKWSRSDLVTRILNYFTSDGDAFQKTAAQKFLDRREADTLPLPIDPNHDVGEFIGDFYAEHRFSL